MTMVEKDRGQRKEEKKGGEGGGAGDGRRGAEEGRKREKKEREKQGGRTTTQKQTQTPNKSIPLLLCGAYLSLQVLLVICINAPEGCQQGT